MRIATLSFCAMLAGCSSTSLVTTGAPSASFELALAGATLDEVAVAVSRAGVPMVIDARASLLAECVRVTVQSGGPIPREHGYNLLAASLQQTGLALEATPAGWVVHVSDREPLPASCTQWVMRTLLGTAHVADLGAAPTVTSALGESPVAADHVAPPSESLVAADHAAPPSAANILEGIRRLSETEVLVTRVAADAILALPADLMRGTRVVPYARDGRVAGVRLFGIRETSVPAALGIRNGDLLLDIAGHPIASPETALEAYAAVRAAEVIPVRLERSDREMHLAVRVVTELPPQP